MIRVDSLCSLFEKRKRKMGIGRKETKKSLGFSFNVIKGFVAMSEK